ncbi:alpha/beta fold hydrolase [Oscillatoria sp. FACHB-1406]|uniref:alpha/beta fold hydrolase n=1 Tax=Oscillatoria sp. FACHB-1406 TaxID=2692846 RepID=UPI0016890978|nr:alpha/beta fold hydrolase [Oscillatoria sp. FACHB-1406]MBD2580581.1 alpha/beta fold hydrolase [Oscillatoria sp. FACHB-1406]
MSATAIAQPSSFPGIFWQWRGHSIYYVAAGCPQPNRPPLLLVHGFGASTDHWRKNIAELQADFAVYAIDLLGFGRSAKPNLEYSGKLWSEQLRDFIQEVIEQPAVIAGNSIGGYVALCTGANYPETTAGVVLLNSAGPFTEVTETVKETVFQEFIKNGMRSLLLQPWANFLLFQYVRQRWVIRQTLEKVYRDRSAVSDRLVEEIYRPSCDEGAAQVFASVFKSPRGEMNDALLAKLQAPLLLLWGDADPWMNARLRSPKFRQHYPALSEYFLQAGHCPHDEVPQQVNALIREWVSNL